MQSDNEFVGKSILVGLTYLDRKGQLLHQLQYHGVISRITAKGIFIRLPNGKDQCSLPPDTSVLKQAMPGNYRLRSTGEIVTNPDYLAQWTITKQDQTDADKPDPQKAMARKKPNRTSRKK